MRDFRDAKAIARSLRGLLAAKGTKISVGESLELTSKALGAADWNTLAALIQAADTPPAGDSKPAPPTMPSRASSKLFADALDSTLHRGVAAAAQRLHQSVTVEHLLLALIDDPDAAVVMTSCQVDLAALSAKLTGYIDERYAETVVEGGDGPTPSAGFQRTMQRAIVNVQSSGRGQVSGANVLIAIFWEGESGAAALLAQHGMTRLDAVNFVTHGVIKGRTAGA
jgi:hypothetical protein